MKKLFFKLSIFLSPFILNALLVVIVDPYNFYNISHIIPDSDKKKCIGRTMETTPRGNICWKILEYERNPTEEVLIGDSRMVHINNSISGEVLGKEVYNFSIPGANFMTIHDIFWEAIKNPNLNTVYVQISFLNFSKNVTYNLMESLDKYRKAPLRYLYDKDIIVDSWVNIYYSFSRNENFIDINYRERDVDNWGRSKMLSDRRLDRYSYSVEYEGDLMEMERYCEENNIKLIFILIPTHVEFIDKIEEKGFINEYTTFKNFVQSLGQTINLKYMEESNMDGILKYKDYFHYQPETLDSITRLIWQEAKQMKEITPNAQLKE